VADLFGFLPAALVDPIRHLDPILAERLGQLHACASGTTSSWSPCMMRKGAASFVT
jgi:hypothetical protein